MSTNPERAVSYVLNKSVTEYMDKDVLILSQNTLTREAARMLRHYETDDIIVTNEDRIPVGIVTDEDILSQVSDVTVYAEATKLKDIMTTPLVTINEKSTLQDALHKMRDNSIRKLPVLTKKNEVIGMIFQTTIANVIRDATASEPRVLSPPVKAVLGNLGFVLQFAGVLLLVPAIVATILEDTTTATGIYLTTVLLLVTGFFLNSYGEKSSLNLQQASILVFSSLFLLSLFGTIPYLYVFPTEETNIEVFGNAFFSSAAGFTTGGISLFDTPEEQLTQSFTFYRSYTQLVGGMSFIYLVITAFYPESKLQSMRGFISGRTLHMKELFSTITVIFAVYIVIVAMLLYFFGQENLLDDFSLAMSTLATGGFVPSSTIIDNLGWQEEVILMGAMILGALPFTFHYAFVRKKFLAPKLGKEVLTYFAILGGATALFIGISGLEPLESTFYSVSASTTAGLQLQSLAGLSGLAHAILISLMFIGGCGFSTAGGLKIFRLFHLKNCRSFFSSVKRKELSTQTKKEITSTLIIVALFPVISAITGLHLAEMEDVPYQDAFFEAAGVITTGGLSAGVIDSDTDPATKIVLGFLMIFGRLEIIAIIYIFVPRLS
ncbi:Cation transport protein [Marine Group I thaumarchaeote SCGC AAA799-E16]|uniref:Cation transport protein n=4 Tax=Marine Group I TaxID=905826 RepID=A0A087S7N8_9ARCH|nr:Cation transport protein [Marine Group I thaumarchaeote SCGC AAA799-N04]KER06051.1 Cation transport protein [Marine Group I thaumarchaeote SCGC AAA799-E16]KFM18167.1 Cation transport protein [Marine Group I thaumarchaeote SCGC RSA3]KFM21742.1 Cation transport protein [Marine Group I thaumarchaeote SCGC AAA799-B03]